jgi:hypothetical protein
MTNEVTKQTPPLDGFAGFEDAIEGEDQPRGPLQGTRRVKFDDATWATADGEEITPDREFIVANIVRVVQKIIDKKAVETRVLEPGEKFPNFKKLNEAAPREEWGEDFNGNPRGPWIGREIVLMLDPISMDRFAFSAYLNTIGSVLAVRDLAQRTNDMRNFRGAHVNPVITCSDVFLPTKYGGRQRPHFKIPRWVPFGGDGKTQALLPPTSPTLPPADAQAGQASSDGLHTVEPPSVAETLDDSIPSKGGVSESDRSAGSRAPQVKRSRAA